MAMSTKRVIILLIVSLLTLSGCYRQATNETYQSVDSDQNAPSGQSSPVAQDTPTEVPPLATVTSDSTPIPFDTVVPEATTEPLPTVDTGSQNNVLASATPFIVSTPELNLSTSTPIQVRPSNTPVQLITPGAPAGPVEFPTPTPPPTGTPVPTSDSTNRDTTTSNVSSECTYTVRSGDSLFRIALNNDVSLEALRSFNNIQGDLIQPGQVLVIPGCEETTTTTTQPTTVAPESTALPEGTRLHVVRSGETMGGIARIYGVSVEAILAANNLSDPNVIKIDQELIIP